MEPVGRVVRHFQEELEQLKTRLLEMGGAAEEQVRLATKALADRDTDALDRALVGDQPINQLHIEIDNRCFTLLALFQPMAADLRTIVAAVKITASTPRPRENRSAAASGSWPAERSTTSAPKRAAKSSFSGSKSIPSTRQPCARSS